MEWERQLVGSKTGGNLSIHWLWFQTSRFQCWFLADARDATGAKNQFTSLHHQFPGMARKTTSDCTDSWSVPTERYTNSGVSCKVSLGHNCSTSQPPTELVLCSRSAVLVLLCPGHTGEHRWASRLDTGTSVHVKRLPPHWLHGHPILPGVPRDTVQNEGLTGTLRGNKATKLCSGHRLTLTPLLPSL